MLPDCDIYRGHFPGNPVCPGVCGIEMVKELAMRMTGKKLFFRDIKRCRLTAIASPEICPEQEVTINIGPEKEGRSSINASITDSQKTYMEYKGEMTYVSR